VGSARRKINVSCINGCLVISAALGLVAKSWAVFAALLVLTVLGSLYSGELRLSGKPQ
jgi:hypothetical protein